MVSDGRNVHVAILTFQCIQICDAVFGYEYLLNQTGQKYECSQKAFRGRIQFVWF